MSDEKVWKHCAKPALEFIMDFHELVELQT